MEATVALDGVGAPLALLLPCEVETSRGKLACVCNGGRSGGARLGNAGASIEGNVRDGSRAGTGGASLLSLIWLGVSMGRLSVLLNFPENDLAELDSLPRDRGGRCSGCVLCDGEKEGKASSE